MNIHYDPKEDAMYIRLSEMPYAESEEVRDGVIFDKDAWQPKTSIGKKVKSGEITGYILNFDSIDSILK